MALLHLIIIALVQGVTEFLPISSSAHLILAPRVTGYQDQGLMVDVAVHVGTLLAVLIYFRAEVGRLIVGGLSVVSGNAIQAVPADRRLALGLVLGTIPVVIVGFLLSRGDVMQTLRTLEVIGWASLGFGIVLWLADRFAPRLKNIDQLGLSHAVVIGLAQVIALIPGSSRAGMTMTAARLLGFNRPDAARFSMLLGIPTILAAGVLITLDIVDRGQCALGIDALIAAGLSCLAALAAIHLFLGWLQHASMTPFVIYRCALGLVLLGIAYFG